MNTLFEITNQPTPEQQIKYNDELEKFYAKQEKIAKEKFLWTKILSNSVMLNLKISNNGTAPANDIDLFLTFPNSVKIFFYENIPTFEKIKPPYKPQYRWDMDKSMFGLNPLNSPKTQYIYLVHESIKEGTLEHYDFKESENGTIIHYNYSNSLKHNLKISLEPFWVLSKSNFKINFELLISNYPKKIEDELNISVLIEE